MHRICLYLTAFITTITISVPAFAEPAATPVTTDKHSRNWSHATNDESFRIDLPTVNYTRLIEQLRAHRAALSSRKEQISRYLDENGMDSKDVLITVILPGGLLYAAIRKGRLEQAKAELAEVTEDMEEISHDLLAMQAAAGELTVAQLQ